MFYVYVCNTPVFAQGSLRQGLNIKHIAMHLISFQMILIA